MRTTDPKVVGREEELAAIERWLEGPCPSTLLIEGEAGIGKTTLLQAGVDAARERSLRVLAAKPTQAEAGLSFAALGDLLEGALEDVLDALPAPQQQALRAALLLEGAPLDSLLPDPRAVAVAFLGSLRALTLAKTVLVGVDDVQWLDPASAATLAFAARRLATEDVLLLLARRAGHEDAVTSELADVEHVSLAGLSAGALHRLVRERLDVVLARPALRRLHALSGGNPFYALELAAAYGRGEIRLGRDEPLPPSLDALVGHRIAALPEKTRVALAAAAALARPTQLVAPAEVLAPAIAADVIALEDCEIRFTHPLLASAAYATVAPERRQALHARLATIAEDGEERARHLALAAEGPDEEVACALEEAARRAAARGAPASAADLLAESRRLTPTGKGGALAERQRAEARYVNLAGDPHRARALLEALLAITPRGPARAETLAELAFVNLFGVDWRSSVELYRSALDEAEGDLQLEARIEVQDRLRGGRLEVRHAGARGGRRNGDRGAHTDAVGLLELAPRGPCRPPAHALPGARQLTSSGAENFRVPDLQSGSRGNFVATTGFPPRW